MLGFAHSLLTEHTDHPILVSLFITAAAFAGAGFLVEHLTANGVASAFFVVYAIIAAFLGGLGYAVLYLSKLAVKLRHQMGATA